MKGYYSKIRELEKELERNQKIYSKLCRQRENLNDRKGVVMLTECMDLEIQLISVSITISSISEQLRYLHEEYKKYKEMTPVFKELEEERKKIYIKAPEKVSNYTESVLSGEDTIDNLLEAFKKFLERKELDKPLETTVTKREYSVRERKNNIKKILMTKKKAYLDDLFEEYNRPIVVVTFLSILEMVKEKDVVINQDKNFDKILIELRN